MQLTFYGPLSILKFIALENYLSELTGIKIALALKDALKPYIGTLIKVKR